MTNEIDTVRYNKVIELGELALKIAIVINGGAAIALLAFIGSVWSPYYNAPLTIIFLSIGLGSFSLGVLSGATAATAAYFSEFHHFHENIKPGDRYYNVAVLIGLLSLLFFFVGICSSVTAILVHIL